ncbi:unnamed protein product [Parascedosporium putredinis]|uniref:Xylanolytic transcriptional activator regulatory domain-containing protein n=1 Tax=Parascedosporium putredinis TaxID=1442378 RepID=A0A9P1M9U3_9PEZI|nr:unnamed protein product [Parascedosporium putredinis]CAI7992676.1 unnamed protein product [Parascedosporium putredinis]
MAEWNQGQIDRNLLKALCASGMRLLCLERPLDKSIPIVWMREVQQELLSRLGKTTIADLQTLLLLIKFHFTFKFTEEVWTLLAMAARIAFTKRLNYERPTVDPVVQECLRRLMWTVFYLDKLFSGGIEDLTLCPSERIHIRLPSNDRCFQRGIRSRSHFLRDPGDKKSDMDALAYRIKLFDLRDRIFRYTRRVVLEKSSPFVSREELCALDEELVLFKTTLPDELETDDAQLKLMCHSSEARTYVMLHSTIHLCRCDLYRFLVPGIREAVSSEAMENTPPEYIDHCQRQCLGSALSLCDLWSKLYHLETDRDIDSPTLVIAMSPSIAPDVQNQPHRRSKHAFAPDGNESVEIVARSPIPAREPWMGRVGTLETTSGDRRGWPTLPVGRELDPEDAYFTGYNPLNPHNLVYGAMDVGAAALEHPEMAMPVDPFDLQLNPYADAQLFPVINP